MEGDLKSYNDNFRSDKKVSGGKMGICPLCQGEKQLILSHIAPKWVYYWAKQEDRGRIVGNYESLGVSVIEQDGSKHYILCQSCDQFLGDAENYVKMLMHGSVDEKAKLGIQIDNENYRGLNFELIQRFVFGLMFKAHFATSAPYHNISFSNEILADIRDRIINPIQEDLDYPIIAMRFNSEIVPDIDPKAIIIPKYQKGENNEDLISFLLAGWEWVIFFNKNRWFDKTEFINMRLLTDRTMLIPVGDIIDKDL